MRLRLVTPPAEEPITLAEAKTHLRVEDARDDDYITGLISVARAYLEQICWRGLMTQTYEAALPGFLGDDRLELPQRRNFSDAMLGYEWTNTDRAYRFNPYLELPLGQLDASSPISSFTYIDPAGVTQTLASTVYELDSYSVPGRVRLKNQQTWPLTLDRWNAVVIRYKVGYQTPDDVPPELKHAIKLHLSQLFENRSPESSARYMSPVALSYDALIAPYRLIRF